MPKQTLREVWKETWGSKTKRYQILIGTALMFIVIGILPVFFAHIEKRKGFLLNDWLLARVPPHDVSIFIFSIIWGMALLIFLRALYRPTIYITYCWSLFFVCLARFASIALVALDAPKGLIPLLDPLTGVFYGEALITKDLFFSGHIATLTLMFLCLEKRNDKIVGFAAILIVACLLVVQHIHYTVDILAAPFIAYASYKTIRYLFYKEHM